MAASFAHVNECYNNTNYMMAYYVSTIYKYLMRHVSKLTLIRMFYNWRLYLVSEILTANKDRYHTAFMIQNVKCIGSIG